MILSQWIFSVERKKTISAYALHSELWKAFPDAKKEERPFLFRSERRKGELTVLMLSQEEPREIPHAALVRKASFAPILGRGEHYRFSLRANPVKRLKEERCRVPLISGDNLTAWLSRKLDRAARLLHVDILAQESLRFQKTDKQKSEPYMIDIATTDYEGTLECTDQEALLSLIRSGVGPAKAFGCGLLLLRRLS